MRKNKTILSLFRLYLSYHLNKALGIVLFIILLLWCLALFFTTGYPIEQESYIVEYRSYHFNYLEQSLFFLQMIDGVMIAFLVGTELSTLSLFDPMFVPNTSRIKIILAKILANFFLLFLILVFQVLCLHLIAILIFPNYIVDLNSFKLILYLLAPMVELLLFGEFISLLLNSYFIPILIFILHALVSIVLKIEKVEQILCYFIPKIKVEFKQIQFMGNILLYLGICSLLILGSILVFQKKDIST